MTDKLRDAAQQALKALEQYQLEEAEANGAIRVCCSTRPSEEHAQHCVAAEAVMALRAALAQQDAQAVPQEPCAVVKWQTGGPVIHITGEVQVGDLLYRAAPTPPAQPAQQDVQWDPSGLYARGWINGVQVQSLIDWCNSGCAKRADIAFTGGPSRQIAYAIEHLVKRASNPETSEGVFVPRELLAKVANALGLPYEEEHTSLRSKLLDILSFAAQAQRVMLTDEEIESAWKNHVLPGFGERQKFYSPIVYAHAIIEAYERKNGKEAP